MIGEPVLLFRSAAILIALEHAEPEPAPINTMTLDQPVLVEVHHLDEVHLLAFAGITWIFPDQPFAIGEVSGPTILTYWWFPSCENIEERPNLLVAVQAALFNAEKVRNERTLEPSVLRIKREQSVSVIVRKRIVPGEVHPFDWG